MQLSTHDQGPVHAPINHYSPFPQTGGRVDGARLLGAGQGSGRDGRFARAGCRTSVRPVQRKRLHRGISVQVVVQGRSVSVTVTCNGTFTVVSVTLRSNPTSLPVIASDANGLSTHTVDASTPAVGDHSFTFAFSDGTTQVLPFSVSSAQASGIPAGTGSNASGNSGGGLAFTGASAVVPLGAIGAVLVLGGAGAVVSARKRGRVACGSWIDPSP